MQSLGKKSRLKMIRNKLQKILLTKLQKKSATPKKKPLRYLRKFHYPPIYKNWWNSDLFDVTLKRTGKQY